MLCESSNANRSNAHILLISHKHKARDTFDFNLEYCC